MTKWQYSITPPATNHSPQSDEVDHEKVSMASSSTSRIMEKPCQELVQQQQQEALKCPRCDSSNTKFCYYNNYSLSQPRHFCKACKRYWTRGGTLRNVPVGGGCRKNKRIKRPTTTTTSSASAAIDSTASCSFSPSPQRHIDVAASSTCANHHISPLFYGLTRNNNLQYPNCGVNLPLFPRFNSSRIISSSGNGLLLHHQPQLNNNAAALGLGFEATDHHSTLLSSYSASSRSSSTSTSSMFGSCATSSTSPVMMPCYSTMFRELSSTRPLMQQKLMKDGPGGGGNAAAFEGLIGPLEEMQMGISSGGGGDEDALKDVKVELLGQNSRLGLLELDHDDDDEWNTNNGSQNHQIIMDQNHVALSDPNSLYWNNTTTAPTMPLGSASWNDQTNNIGLGPSVTSLI